MVLACLPAAGVSPLLEVETLYTELAPFLARVIRRLVGDGPHVDDLLQETFLVAHRRRGDYDASRAAPRTWLYGIASHLCLRHRRSLFRLDVFRARLQVAPVLAPHAPDREFEEAERRAAVKRVIQQLPFKQREVFVLFEIEGLGGQEIATVLGLPQGTVWTRLSKARATFVRLGRRSLGRKEEA